MLLQWWQEHRPVGSRHLCTFFTFTQRHISNEAVAKLTTVSLLLLHDVSPYQWGQPSLAPSRYLGTTGGDQPSHILDTLVSVSALFLVFIIPPCAAISLTN